ncbi:MAG: thioesterase family protein [Solirubrobacteraceae bacterium]
MVLYGRREAALGSRAVCHALFDVSGKNFLPSEFTRGPWDPLAQHGGAPAALLMRAFERLPGIDGLLIARVTYEFLRPAPLGALTVRAEVVRPGRRVRLAEASILTADGTEVVRARALQVRVADHGAASQADALTTRPARASAGRDAADPSAARPPGPETGTPSDMRAPYRPMFSPDAVEIRFVAGAFHDRGPSTAWLRLRCPLVRDEDASALQRLAAAADFGNGISANLSWDDYVFINPDLTLYVEREPIHDCEWICLQARTRIADGGIGVSESVLYDERGRIGRATQALLVTRR